MPSVRGNRAGPRRAAGVAGRRLSATPAQEAARREGAEMALPMISRKTVTELTAWPPPAKNQRGVNTAGIRGGNRA